MKTEPRAHPAWYHLVRGVVKTYLLAYHRFRVEGAYHIPARGGCVVACNHVSFLDPPVVACGVRHRMIHFLARQTLWEHSRFGHWFLSNYNCIPVDQSRGDVAALRAAVRVLKQGHVLALFPEGTRSPDGNLQPLQGGVGFVAAQARSPVVPAFVQGAYQAFPRGSHMTRPVPIRIRFGPPILPSTFPANPDGKTNYQGLTHLIMARIRGLQP